MKKKKIMLRIKKMHMSSIILLSMAIFIIIIPSIIALISTVIQTYSVGINGTFECPDAATSNPCTFSTYILDQIWFIPFVLAIISIITAPLSISLGLLTGFYLKKKEYYSPKKHPWMFILILFLILIVLASLGAIILFLTILWM